MPQFIRRNQPTEVWQHWQTLADGLHAQRVSLSAADWTARLVGDQSIAMDQSTPARSLAPAPSSPHPAVRSAFHDAGLNTYVDLPFLLSQSAPEPEEHSPLGSVSADLAGELLGALPVSNATVDVVTVATNCAAWWVGFFLIVRDTGVHHVRLLPDLAPVAWADVQGACRAVGLGITLRALKQHLWSAPPDASSGRVVYARATSLAVQMESGMPVLLDQLGELRVVDLVTTSLPWRGQFVKYAGGAGAGQVE